MKSKLRNKAKAELKKLRLLLSKAASGKTINSKRASYLLDDMSELVNYYQYVSQGNLTKAGELQANMDTATRDLISYDVFEQVDLFAYQQYKKGKT